MPQNRLQKRYFLAWWFAKARADIREVGIPPDTRWFAGGIPLYLFRRLVVWTLRWMVSIEPSRRFDCRISVWIQLGSILECYHGARNGTTPMTREENSHT
jgi:hypothetical protein